MPFENSLVHSFTSGAIRAHAPNDPGVYGISNASEWIFIGYTSNIQRGLIEHLQEANSSLNHRRPTGFVYEVCDANTQAARCSRLITEYGPYCNRLQGQR